MPFAREYGGHLSNRSFGGAQVSRTFYARGQTGQQLLLGAYSALIRQMHLKTVEFFPRHEMLDIVKIDGHAKGIITRELTTGKIQSFAADAVILATGATETYFIYQLMQWLAMLLLPGELISMGHYLLILVLHKYIQPVSLSLIHI